MLTYIQKEEYIEVKWKKRLLGRIYKQRIGWVYCPRGCGWVIKSEPFKTLEQLKNYLEGK